MQKVISIQADSIKQSSANKRRGGRGVENTYIMNYYFLLIPILI